MAKGSAEVAKEEEKFNKKQEQALKRRQQFHVIEIREMQKRDEEIHRMNMKSLGMSVTAQKKMTKELQKARKQASDEEIKSVKGTVKQTKKMMKEISDAMAEGTEVSEDYIDSLEKSKSKLNSAKESLESYMRSLDEDSRAYRDASDKLRDLESVLGTVSASVDDLAESAKGYRESMRVEKKRNSASFAMAQENARKQLELLERSNANMTSEFNKYQTSVFGFSKKAHAERLEQMREQSDAQLSFLRSYMDKYGDILEEQEKKNMQTRIDSLSEEAEELQDLADSASQSIRDSVSGSLSDILNDVKDMAIVSSIQSTMSEAIDSYVDNRREVASRTGANFDTKAYDNAVDKVVKDLDSYNRAEAGQFASEFIKSTNIQSMDTANDYMAEIAAQQKVYGTSLESVEKIMWADKNSNQQGKMFKDVSNVAGALEDNENLYTSADSILGAINDNIDRIYGMSAGDSKRQKSMMKSVASIQAIEESSAVSGTESVMESLKGMVGKSYLELQDDEQATALASSIGISTQQLAEMMNSSDGAMEVANRYQQYVKGLSEENMYALNKEGKTPFSSVADAKSFANDDLSEYEAAVKASLGDADFVSSNGGSITQNKEDETTGAIEAMKNDFSTNPVIETITDIFGELDIKAINLAAAATVAKSAFDVGKGVWNIASKIKGGSGVGSAFKSVLLGGGEEAAAGTASASGGLLSGIGTKVAGVGAKIGSGMSSAGSALSSSGAVGTAFGSGAGAAVAGGLGVLGAGAGVFSGLKDIVGSFSKDKTKKEKQDARFSGGTKLGMVGAGAALGSVIPGVGTLVGAGIGGLAALLTGSKVGKALSNTWDKVKEGASNAWGHVKDTVSGAWEFLTGKSKKESEKQVKGNASQLEILQKKGVMYSEEAGKGVEKSISESVTTKLGDNFGLLGRLSGLALQPMLKTMDLVNKKTGIFDKMKNTIEGAKENMKELKDNTEKMGNSKLGLAETLDKKGMLNGLSDKGKSALLKNLRNSKNISSDVASGESASVLTKLSASDTNNTFKGDGDVKFNDAAMAKGKSSAGDKGGSFAKSYFKTMGKVALGAMFPGIGFAMLAKGLIDKNKDKLGKLKDLMINSMAKLKELKKKVDEDKNEDSSKDTKKTNKKFGFFSLLDWLKKNKKDESSKRKSPFFMAFKAMGFAKSLVTNMFKQGKENAKNLSSTLSLTLAQMELQVKSYKEEKKARKQMTQYQKNMSLAMGVSKAGQASSGGILTKLLTAVVALNGGSTTGDSSSSSAYSSGSDGSFGLDSSGSGGSNGVSVGSSYSAGTESFGGVSTTGGSTSGSSSGVFSNTSNTNPGGVSYHQDDEGKSTLSGGITVENAIGKGTGMGIMDYHKNLSGSANVWKPYVIDALQANGLSTDDSNVSKVIKQIGTESSGNPWVENDWDSNWKAGHPSMGLLQCIASTFIAHMFKGHNDIWNGYDNMLAAIHYSKNRYGGGTSLSSSDGGIGSGHGYAVGTPWIPEDQVAMVHEGEMIVPADANPLGTMTDTIQLSDLTSTSSSTSSNYDDTKVVDAIQYVVYALGAKLDKLISAQSGTSRSTGIRRNSDTSYILSM